MDRCFITSVTFNTVMAKLRFHNTRIIMIVLIAEKPIVIEKNLYPFLNQQIKIL